MVVMTEKPERISPREINETIRYTCWTVFKRTGVAPPPDIAGALESWIDDLEASDVTIRGFYDVSSFRGDADLMVWMHAPAAEQVQQGLQTLRRSPLGPSIEQTWSAMGLHRPAEFNKGHVPAFMAGKSPLEWVTVYPFVRSFEWYLLPEEERRAMLVEHGMMGRDYAGILSNTVAAFALGDYEWILALESDELHEIVDMMRHLRSSKARMHVREEIPFFTGRLVEASAVAEVLT
jgi:hydrogen peroxide-dependent heme synthase